MSEDQPHIAEPSERIALKATVLIVLTFMLLAGFLLYVFYARGAFEETQRLVLMADNAEGVSVGSDLSFSGFPIGRVQRIELARTGQARIEIQVPHSQAHWLRSTSMFTLERGLVGGARLRAFSTDMNDPPLPDGAVREVLRGDTTDELPALVASVKRLVGNLEQMTANDSDINKSLEGLRTLAERAGGQRGRGAEGRRRDRTAGEVARVARERGAPDRRSGGQGRADARQGGPATARQERHRG
jgi:phospholipid/cholesterol/gamma-HCH transport system substrate-binding protein